VGGSYVYNPTNGVVLPAGTNLLTVLFTPSDTNYAATNVSVQIIVTPAPLVITADNQSKAYNTILNLGTTAFTSLGLVNGDTVTGVTLSSAGTVAGAPVGNYPIIPSAAAGSGLTNYNIGYSNGTLTVVVAAYTATWPTPTNIVYGTALGTNENKASASVGGTFTYNPTNGVVLPAGTNLLTVLFTPSDTNYAATNLTVQLVVLPASLTITGNPTNKVYGQTIGFAGTEFTAAGLANGDSVTSVTLASAGAANTAGVGNYPIVPSAAIGSGLANYVITYFTNSLLVVNPATLGIRANDTNRLYGAANPAFTYTASGFVNGENAGVLAGAPSLTTTAATNSPLGAYPIIAAAGTLSASNYVFTFTNGTLSVIYTGPMADVIVLLSGPASAIQGGNIVYQIVITNAGPNTSSNVVVSDSLPTNLVFVAASGGGKATNSLVTWPVVRALPAGGSTNYTLTVNAPYAGTFTNVASALAVTFDPNPTNNSGVSPASRASTVVAPPELSAIGGTPALNFQTGLFEERVTVTNRGAVTVLGFRLFVAGLTNGVVLYNASGTTNGVPFVNYNFPLDPSNAATLTLEFYNPTRKAFTHTMWVEAMTPSDINLASTNRSVAITRVFTDTRDEQMRFVIEFNSVPGKTYTVIYSSDLLTWKVATPSIKAAANVTQWYDDGPPKTESKPGSVPSRNYRVIPFN
jgi:uncharacterized repeat protein (TIGR01451 family)